MDVVRIAELADERGMVENREFEDCVIQGPAMLGPAGPVDLESNEFEGGTFESLFHATDKSPVMGIIGLNKVAFRRCRFRLVGFMGPDWFIQQFGGDILREPDPG